MRHWLFWHVHNIFMEGHKCVRCIPNLGALHGTLNALLRVGPHAGCRSTVRLVATGCVSQRKG